MNRIPSTNCQSVHRFMIRADQVLHVIGILICCKTYLPYLPYLNLPCLEATSPNGDVFSWNHSLILWMHLPDTSHTASTLQNASKCLFIYYKKWPASLQLQPTFESENAAVHFIQKKPIAVCKSHSQEVGVP